MSVPETIELLNCTKKRMSSVIKVPQAILKLRKGMGNHVSFERIALAIIITHNETAIFSSSIFLRYKGGGKRNHT